VRDGTDRQALSGEEMNANCRFSLTLFFILATTVPLWAQPGRHAPVPRPWPNPHSAPPDVPGRVRPGYVGQSTTPNQPAAPDKRWGLLVILGLFAIPIVIVASAGRRAQQAKQGETPKVGTTAEPPLPAQPDPTTDEAAIKIGEGEIKKSVETGITLDNNAIRTSDRPRE
jgi:hypothetical protein